MLHIPRGEWFRINDQAYSLREQIERRLASCPLEGHTLMEKTGWTSWSANYSNKCSSGLAFDHPQLDFAHEPYRFRQRFCEKLCLVICFHINELPIFLKSFMERCVEVSLYFTNNLDHVLSWNSPQLRNTSFRLPKATAVTTNTLDEVIRLAS